MSNQKLYEIARSVAASSNPFVDDPFETAVDAVAAAVQAEREQDAKRYRFCCDHGVFPVRAQDGDKWVMFVAITSSRRSSFFGKDPSEVIDAAMAKQESKE